MSGARQCWHRLARAITPLYNACLALGRLGREVEAERLLKNRRGLESDFRLELAKAAIWCRARPQVARLRFKEPWRLHPLNNQMQPSSPLCLWLPPVPGPVNQIGP